MIDDDYALLAASWPRTRTTLCGLAAPSGANRQLRTGGATLNKHGRRRPRGQNARIIPELHADKND